jgi:hypothetical protein
VNFIDQILASDKATRREIFSAMDPDERLRLAQLLDFQVNNPWSRFQDDPVAFVEVGLGETLWTKQKQILESVRDNKRTVIPSAHGIGKTHTAARVIAWWGSSHPAGTARIVTTASTYRQVRNILWGQIRAVHKRYELDGIVNMVEWQINGELVADGFSAANHDETAVQGIHAPHVLVVVDEAGGISPTIGQALESLMTGGHTRLLVLGNPPVDTEAGWFEKICNSDLYSVIPVDAYSTPNFTGETVGNCKTCPPEVALHSLATHLVDKEWVNEVLAEFGADSNFVQARVHARFPKSIANKVIPYSWAELATENDNPAPGQAIRLGVDIASDGGDEFVIAHADGFTCRILHRSSGKANENAVDVAGVVLQYIKEAEATHQERRLSERVRVKIDSIGVGWGVASILEKWQDEQMHNSEIIKVNVAERASDSTKFSNQRAEMWWNGRQMLQPTVVADPGGEEPKRTQQMIRLEVDSKVLAQLSAPQYKSASSGGIAIEKKADMKKRAVGSPDRAEAILLALFEPPGKKVVPDFAFDVDLSQQNQWKL